MIKIFTLFLVCVATQANAVNLDNTHKDVDSFLRALHMVETGGRLGPVTGDRGNALGPFQIWKPYYLDAAQKSKGKLNKTYKHVTDYKYAKQVVLWYFYRYEPKALKSGNWETLARLHNAGPAWRKKKKLTDKYWAKVYKHLK